MTSGAKAGDVRSVDKSQIPSRPTGEFEATKTAGHAAPRAGTSGRILPGAEALPANSSEPILSWDERAPEIAMTPDADKPANRSKIIVAVDDDPENLTIIGKIAHFAGYTFFGVPNGEECVSLAMRVAPRLILLDVQMPGINGYETCRRLRHNPNLAHIPIAFLTARKTREDVRRSLDVGGNDFIIKPFDAVKLSERIHYWVNRSVRLRATRR
jgi:CheY-like chemotaxis protein